MRIKVSIYTFLLPLYFLICFSTSGQSRNTRDNYTGDYENPSSWDPVWNSPSSNIRSTFTINGKITRNGSLYVRSSGKLIIKDTLIIYGDLDLGEENELLIIDNAILIVFGNLRLDEEAVVKANDYFIVTGNIVRSGDDDEGSFKSNDNPVKVFIGGSIPSDLTNNNSRYSALNCSGHPTLPYPNSTCSSGNILDLLNDPIYSFYKTLCPVTIQANISTSGPTSFCDGGNVLLTSSPGVAYSWSNGAESESIEVSSSGSFTVTTINSIGCPSMTSNPEDVQVHPLPSKPIITPSGPLNFCEGEIVTLTAVEASSYSWSNGATSKSIDVSQEGTYNVRVTNQWGCSDQEEAEIIVWQNPSSFAGPDQELYFIFETRLNAELSSGETGEWEVLTGGSQVADVYFPSSYVDGLSIGENKFLWRVSNGNCYDESEIIVYVEDLFLPNVITPNNDGKNDYFILEKIPANTELIIFDRVGKLRFSESNYSNNWNGISSEGIALQEDTYFYVLKFNDGMIKMGYILLKR